MRLPPRDARTLPRGRACRWAKYLTQLQMVQFVFMNAHGLYMLAHGCAYPPRLTLIYLAYIFVMLLLFLNFYLTKHGKRAEGGKRKLQ